MSKEEEFFSNVLDAFSSIKLQLEDTKQIDKCLKNLKLNKSYSVSETLELTKNLINKLYEGSVDIKNKFYDSCNELVKSKDTSDKENSLLSSNTNSKKVSSNKSEENGAGDSVSQEEWRIQKEKSDYNESASTAEKNDKSVVDEEIESDTESSCTSDVGQEVTDLESLDKKEKNKCESKEKSFDKETCKPKTDSSASDSPDIKNNNNEKVEKKPQIRVIDLNKLMDPEAKKSVKFDTSLIVISSDEDVCEVKDFPKLDTKRPDKEAKCNVDSKKTMQKPEIQVKSSSSEASKSSLSDRESLSNDNDDDYSKRASSRLKTQQKELHHKFDQMRAHVTRRRPKNEQKLHFRKRAKIENLSKNSDSSELSSDEISKKTKQLSGKKEKIRDEQFSQSMYISLPRIKCEKLQEIYLRDKGPQNLKSLTNLSSCERSQITSSKSSDETEKSYLQKSKKIDAEKEQHSPSKDSSSDDEPLIIAKDKNNSKKQNKETILTEQKEILQEDEVASENGLKDLNETDKKTEDNINVEDNIAAEWEHTDKEDKNNSKRKTTDQPGKKDTGSESENTNEQDPDKFLTGKLDSSDSEEEFLMKVKENGHKKTKSKIKKKVIDSESEEEKKQSEESDDSVKITEAKISSSSSESEKEEETRKPQRKRIKRTKNSSSEDEDDRKTRKRIRGVIGMDKLSETTKRAEAEEKERKARIAEKQKKYNNIFEETKDSKVEKLVLEYDDESQKDVLPIDKHFIKKLKPHQASGVRFMWDACFESLERTKKDKGSGCILAHCMGLGKTLQVITLSHTLLTHRDRTHVNKIMVVCPVNTVLNWKSEFKMWMPKRSDVEVYELTSCKNYERQYRIQEWHEDGGVLIIGYTMFRMISNPDNKKINKKMRKVFIEGLVDPGPDLVVCDEGHLLKNEKTNLSIAMNRIKTPRRIVLTGTPLQNNLKEYWCMVQFIKPNLLGTYKEYLNRFVNPITNGQYTDSTQHDILIMRKRSHVLHKLLDGVVQRRDYSVLEPYLPPKHEYVLFVKLTEVQVKIYKCYMENYARHNEGSNRTSVLFNDYQVLQRICTHPRVMLDKSSEKKDKEDDEESEGSLKDFIDDRGVSTDSKSSSSSSGSDSEICVGSDDDTARKKKYQQKVRVTRAQAAHRRENDEASDPELEEIRKEWWQEFCDGDELDNINNSGKLFLLFHILKECEEIGDKLLVFSQSLLTLNCIEYFLEKIDEATQAGKAEKVGGYSGSWSLGLDYFRLDGTSSCDNRAAWCNMFNNPDNTRARLFLISTKAGGLGINLVSANRVVIFDVSWNPSHDIQSIYRVYRFGQTKPSYIYRFVTYGAMEMKIYERQVTKQAISKRVIDEQQIDRHYNQTDLQELYQCDLEPEDRPIPLVPKDVLLGEMLQKYEKTIYKYHLHQSLLENKEDETLNEEERKAAWEEFENEKEIRKHNYATQAGFPQGSMNAQLIASALSNIVRKDNPTWSEIQIKGIIPALVKQLQVQMSENDLSMYNRVQEEITQMQVAMRNQMTEAYYQQQFMRLVQQQQQNVALDRYQLNPAAVANMHSFYNQGGASTAQAFPPQNQQRRPNNNVVIDLND